MVDYGRKVFLLRRLTLLVLTLFLLFPAAVPIPLQAQVNQQVHPNIEETKATIREAAYYHGVSGDRMVSIASCETGGKFNPDAYNSAGPYRGIFQFDEQTYYGGTRYEGEFIPVPSKYNQYPPENVWAASNVAAWYMSYEGYGRWPVCQFD